MYLSAEGPETKLADRAAAATREGFYLRSAGRLARAEQAASVAKHQAESLFEIELEVDPEPAAKPPGDFGDHHTTGHVLSAVERLGWKLEHVGYYFKPLSERGVEIMASQRTTVSGVTVGVYLFRNTTP